MIDAEKLASVKARIAGEDVPNPLAVMAPADLRKLRREIDGLLPVDTMATLNLEAELVEQYNKTKGLMNEVLDDEETPANQKAQVANSVVGALGQLVKLQEDLKRQETLKIMEACLIDVVKTLPDERKVEFYADYERLATKAGLM